MSRKVKPRVIADVREEASGVPRLLRSLGLDVVVERLEAADYVVSEEIAVERKTVGDFANSIFDGRLFEQARSLKTLFAKPFIVVEGSHIHVRRRFRNLNVYLGALASLTVDYGVQVVSTLNVGETASLIACLARRVYKVKPSKPVTVKLPKTPGGLAPQVKTLVTLPGVGVTVAMRLLDHFGSLESIFNASASELSRVQGLGWSRALAIRRFLTEKTGCRDAKPGSTLD